MIDIINKITISFIVDYLKKTWNKIFNYLILDQQENLYEKVADEIISGQISASEVIFIQHSGHRVVGVINKLLKSDIDVILYQQHPDFDITGLDLYKERIENAHKDIIASEFVENNRGKLTIKRFTAPAVLRAMVVNNQVLVVSWFIYKRENEQLKIRGSENVGLLVRKKSPKFDVLYKMINQLKSTFDNECAGELQQLSPTIFLHNCKIPRP